MYRFSGRSRVSINGEATRPAACLLRLDEGRSEPSFEQVDARQPELRELLIESLDQPGMGDCA